MKCGCSEIEEANIKDWEKLYERRYGHKFAERNPNALRVKVYGLTMGELKQMFHESPYRQDILYLMYPSFPRYLTKVESTILFFDRICKDGRLNELRNLLIEKHK